MSTPTRRGLRGGSPEKHSNWLSFRATEGRRGICRPSNTTDFPHSVLRRTEIPQQTRNDTTPNHARAERSPQSRLPNAGGSFNFFNGFLSLSNTPPPPFLPAVSFTGFFTSTRSSTEKVSFFSPKRAALSCWN